jgi:hypothetical protein
MESEDESELLRGLQQLAAGAFPRTCPTCGRVYRDFAQFLRETRPLERHSGLKEVEEEDNSTAVEVYRNCVCGSTLMDLARDRREAPEAGGQGRDQFESMLQKLTQRGLEPNEAYTELRKLMRGEASPVIEQLLKQE